MTLPEAIVSKFNESGHESGLKASQNAHYALEYMMRSLHATRGALVGSYALLVYEWLIK